MLSVEFKKLIYKQNEVCVKLWNVKITISQIKTSDKRIYKIILGICQSEYFKTKKK